VSYLELGQVFPANMTGNTVLLAIGTATADYASALRSLLALGGFVVGAFLAGLATGRHATDLRAVRMRAVLLAEFAVQVAALGWWLTLPSHPHGAAQLALIGMFGMAMGLQSAAISRLPVGVSTTYITGTWTAVSTWAAAGFLRRSDELADRSSDARVQVPVLAWYFAAALCAGYLFRAAGGAVAAIPAGAVGLVSLVLCRRPHAPGPRTSPERYADQPAGRS
jgi:uncharacterized membrane protein YoaK (UPF0700 family)